MSSKANLYFSRQEIDKMNGKPFDPAPIIPKAVSNIVSSIIFGSRFDYEDPVFKGKNCMTSHDKYRIGKSEMAAIDQTKGASIKLGTEYHTDVLSVYIYHTKTHLAPAFGSYLFFTAPSPGLNLFETLSDSLFLLNTISAK